MELLPQFTLSLNTAIWFTLAFWIGNLIILKSFPKHYKDRVLKMPKFEPGAQKWIGMFNFFLFQGLVISALFIPLKTGSTLFLIGLALFVFAYLAYIKALVDYATSNPEKPVTKGIYRISRNPQQIMTIIMWVGVGLMTNCGLIISLCALQFFTVYPTFVAQEKYCIERYGEDFQNYMAGSPRYLFFF